MPPPTGREGSLFSEDDSKRKKEKMKAGQGWGKKMSCWLTKFQQSLLCYLCFG